MAIGLQPSQRHARDRRSVGVVAGVLRKAETAHQPTQETNEGEEKQDEGKEPGPPPQWTEERIVDEREVVQ
jgi:hypothetical protein